MKHTEDQTMKIFVLCILLAASIGYVTANDEDEEAELLYSAASTLHDASDIGPSSHEASEFPRHFEFESLQNMPVVVIQPRTPIQLRMSPDENVSDFYKSLNPDRIIKLLQSAISSVPTETDDPSAKDISREAKMINFGGNGGIRSIFSLPFNGFQSFIPRIPSSSNSFSGAVFSNPPSNGWQQRFKNSFSNMFSFAKPMQSYGGMASTNNPSFLPFHHYGHGGYNPFNQPVHIQSMGNQFYHSNPQQVADLSNAASYGHATKLELGNYFNPYSNSPVIPQPQFGSDLSTSGSSFAPNRMVPVANHQFAQYVSSVPRHKPLFDNIGGLKGASLEMSNAFADFADSHEHGPEVTQKFGSVGHTINTFLQMMGLGSSGGFMDDVGGFGGAGDYASMDSTPISRSLDFYPGYGNQAVLEEMEDFPIFNEDITEQFLTKMNLTHLLCNVSVLEDDEKSKVVIDELDITVRKPEMIKDVKANTSVSNEGIETYVTFPEKNLYFDGPKGSMIQNLPYGPALTYEVVNMNKNSEKGAIPKSKPDNDDKLQTNNNGTKKAEITDDTKGTSPSVDKMKKIKDSDGKKKSPEKEPSVKETPITPNVNYKVPTITSSIGDKKDSEEVVPIVSYKVPSTHSTVAPQDRKPPIAIFQSFPSRSNSDLKAPDPPTYAPAQSIPHHESESNPNKLIDDDILRPWVPVSSGHGYVEKRPTPILDMNQDSDLPKGLSIVYQLLSGTSRHQPSQE